MIEPAPVFLTREATPDDPQDWRLDVYLAEKPGKRDIAAIRELISLAGEPDRPCADADRIAQHQLESVKTKITGLKLLQKELERMLHDCAHGKIAECRVVETLGDHALCKAEHHAHA